MKKNTIRLNEAGLRNIVAESVKRVLKEGSYGDFDFEEKPAKKTPLYLSREEAIKRGFTKDEYQDFSKGYETWHDKFKNMAIVKDKYDLKGKGKNDGYSDEYFDKGKDGIGTKIQSRRGVNGKKHFRTIPYDFNNHVALPANESKLNKIVAESIRKVLKEDFRPVDNLSDYIRQNNIQMRQASKFARINAVQARGGERINTIASDGVQETTNIAKPGDYIVNNVGNPNNKWIIDAATFAKKYQPDPTQQGVFMPKGGPMMAGQINEPISFTAPWGEQMNIDKGGYLLQTPGSESDIYGISGKDFDSTYRFNQ